MTTKTKVNIEPTPDADEPVGIICPRCGCRHMLPDPEGGHVSNWHTTKTELKRGVVRRRRICRHCGRRVFTVETVEAED